MKLAFKKFNELKKNDINFDYHIHTNYTDGKLSPEEMVEAAIQLNLNSIAFTEHVNKSSLWFDSFSEKITLLKRNENINILLGIEAKVNDFKGSLDATQNMIEKSDITIGVIHRYPDSNGLLSPLKEIKLLEENTASEIEFKLIMGLLENKDIDVIGHPFGVYSLFFTEFPKEYMENIIRKAVKKNIAIEINTKYILNRKIFFKILKKYNPYISIGSDAHDKSEIARNFNLIKEAIK